MPGLGMRAFRVYRGYIGIMEKMGSYYSRIQGFEDGLWKIVGL